VNNYGYIRGGSDRYFFDLTNLLRENGHSVSELVSRDSRNVSSTPWDVRGFRPEKPEAGDLLRFFYSRDAKKVARRLVEKERPDLVHLHIYYGQMTASILGEFKARGIPVVQTLHEYKLICPIATMLRNGRVCDACCSGSFWKAAVHRCNRGSLTRSIVSSVEAYTSRGLGSVRNVDHFIAVSDFVRETMIKYGVSPGKISTVHNFIECAEFTPGNDPGNYFIYFGRLEEIKGIRTLLAALERVGGKLVIAGEGDFRAEAEKLAKERHLDVEFVGFRKGTELHDLIRRSRCVLVPSEWNETFGLVILEANALGKPVIASRIGGMPEVIQDGTTGMLFESGDVTELAEAMRWMWNNPIGAIEMGRRGRKESQDKFGKQEHYRKIMSIYERAFR